MAKTRKITKNKNRVDAFNNGGARPWSHLNHELLCLVMMRLGVVDFVAFSGVCKPWRSLALSNWNMFMASRPPMSISISNRAYKKHCYYSLKDFQGRKFKAPLPRSGGRTCVGLTCGYLVLYGRKTRNFWLVNPITRHEIHFPDVYFYKDVDPEVGVRAILVFLPSISRWVFLVLCPYTSVIWFYIAGKKAWDLVPLPSISLFFLDLHELKGKIYAIGMQVDHYRLYELRLDPKPNLTYLKTKNSPDAEMKIVAFASSGENLYAMERFVDENSYEIHKLDFGEMKWVSPEEKTMEEHAFFVSDRKHSNAAMKTEMWSDSWLPFQRYFSSDTNGNDMIFSAYLWYFPHDCMNVNFMRE